MTKSAALSPAVSWINGHHTPIENAFNSRQPIFESNNSFLNIHYLNASPAAIIPLCDGDKCIGVMIVGDNDYTNYADIYKMMANYLALFIQNKELSNKVLLNTHTDALTNLNNHRRLQEILVQEIDKAKRTDTKMSVVIFDINNISQINKDFGAAKGDEIIKLVSDKISQNIRTNDSARKVTAATKLRLFCRIRIRLTQNILQNISLTRFPAALLTA